MELSIIYGHSCEKYAKMNKPFEPMRNLIEYKLFDEVTDQVYAQASNYARTQVENKVWTHVVGKVWYRTGSVILVYLHE